MKDVNEVMRPYLKKIGEACYDAGFDEAVNKTIEFLESLHQDYRNINMTMLIGSYKEVFKSVNKDDQPTP